MSYLTLTYSIFNQKLKIMRRRNKYLQDSLDNEILSLEDDFSFRKKVAWFIYRNSTDKERMYISCLYIEPFMPKRLYYL